MEKFKPLEVQALPAERIETPCIRGCCRKAIGHQNRPVETRFNVQSSIQSASGSWQARNMCANRLQEVLWPGLYMSTCS